MAMKKYPSELRERAVPLYRETSPQPTLASVARKLGIGSETLRNWIRQDEAVRVSVVIGPPRRSGRSSGSAAGVMRI
jgi:transposase-like protein